MLARLRRTLVERLEEGDLRDLCFDLGVNYDDLPGKTRADKARELITYFKKRNRLPKLIRTIEEIRPDIDLSDIPFDIDADSIWITTREGIDLTGYGSRFLRRLATRPTSLRRAALRACQKSVKLPGYEIIFRSRISTTRSTMRSRK